jgi:putative lipoprotein
MVYNDLQNIMNLEEKMSNYGYISGMGGGGRHGRRNRKPSIWKKILILIIILAIVCGGAYAGFRYLRARGLSISQFAQNIGKPAQTTVAPETTAAPSIDDYLARASALAASYDYDGAISLLSDPSIASDEKVSAAINEYQTIKSSLVRQDVKTCPHVFFHTLIWDATKAFDGDSKAAGYNEVMTTINEFNKILQNLYDRGYVLVHIHDLAHEEDDPATGTKHMVEGNILLPPGKKPIVMSQDDVCYYEYMTGDGFANRLVIGDDGKPTTEMDMPDGTKQRGNFDLIPILDQFVKEHPDFSYKGAKAIIAVTGYNGVFGYRTDASYQGKNPNIEADKETVKKIAQALKDDGYELASHSWGHRHLGSIPYQDFVTDTDKWDQNVASLIGPTDIILYPFGTDIADWHPYKDDNPRYIYLRDKGFRYFCTVDSSKYWVQINGDVFRQGRRNLDGYRMWRDINEPNNQKLSDLFNASEVFDPVRPTPVGEIRS